MSRCRESHSPYERSRWFSAIHITHEVLDVLDPEQLRQLLDRHYEAEEWADTTRTFGPCISVFTAMVGDETALAIVDVNIKTWPGERTFVELDR